MKLSILSAAKTEKGSMQLPIQFGEEIRPDIIKRAVEVIQANKRQKYGASPEAGQRASAKVSRRRHDYRGAYGIGISRVPRKVMSRRGTRMNWTGAVAPGTVGGRRAHPPKAEKVWCKSINVNERRKAIRSAMAATLVKEIVAKRGHKVPENYPFILDDSFEKLAKTKQVKDALMKLGFQDELNRCEEKTIRSGTARMRGRKYRRKKSVLLVVSKECALQKSASNIPGIDIVEVNLLNAELLAPGTDIGRLALFTESALKRMDAEKLFFPRKKAKKEKQAKQKKGKEENKAEAQSKIKPKKAKPQSKDKSKTIKSAKKAEPKK